MRLTVYWDSYYSWPHVLDGLDILRDASEASCLLSSEKIALVVKDVYL